MVTTMTVDQTTRKFLRRLIRHLKRQQQQDRKKGHS
jgi:hypothetical protein